MSAKDDQNQLTLVDYFVVAGYSAQVGLTVDKDSERSAQGFVAADEFRPPLQRSFVANVIEYYPKRRKGQPFSPEIISLCMPKGLRFYTEKTVPADWEVHTFANIRADGSRVNGTAITFYEEVEDEAVCAMLAAMQKEHVMEVTALERNAAREHVPPGTITGGTHTLPRGRRGGTKRISYYDGGGQGVLYMSKTLCLLTRLPIVGASTSLLQMMYELSRMGKECPLPLESYIYWMLHEVPLPSPGTTLKIRLLNNCFVLQRPTLKELPFFDYSLTQLFNLVPVEKFLRIFTAFLLEHQIVICSRNVHRLMLVCESLCALAFPFRWQLAYVPILPCHQLEFIEAPVPYVMGLCYEDMAPLQLFTANMCVLDVDTGKCDIPEDLPFFPQHRSLVTEIKTLLDRLPTSEPSVQSNGSSEGGNGMRMSRSFDISHDSVPTLPSSHIESVLSGNSALARVQEIARRAGVHVEMNTLHDELQEKKSCFSSQESRRYFHDMKVNNGIRETVASRMAVIFNTYDQFIVTSALNEEDNRDSLITFDKGTFLADQPESFLPFLSAFLESQMFTSFVDAKLLSSVTRTSDEYVERFDALIAALPSNMKEFAHTTTLTPLLALSDELISGREEQLDYVVPAPHPLLPAPSQPASPTHYCTRDGRAWPALSHSALAVHDATESPMPSPWKQRHARFRPHAAETIRPISTYGGTGIAGETTEQQNARFVEQLLKDTKVKTKRMVVEKMGKEAVELGHGEVLSGVEENTLVASLCDLLERIWAHGVKSKMGRSAFWSYVASHQQCSKLSDSGRTNSTSVLSPAGRPVAPPAPPFPRMRRTASSMGEEYGSVPSGLPPLPRSSPRVKTGLSDVSSLLSALDGNSDGDDWKSSLVRAAKSVMETAFGEETDPNGHSPSSALPHTTRDGGAPTVLTSAWSRWNGRMGTQVPPPQQGVSVMKKSSSVSDFSSPAWASVDEERESELCVRDSRSGKRSESAQRRQRSWSRSGQGEDTPLLHPLSQSLSTDFNAVMRMSEMKSDVGYARAFIRLALERRLLHKHLHTLLSNHSLLTERYKRHAFVRQEDEREQFLMHIMSLNAAHFRCFTNTFTKTKVAYQVALCTGGWKGRVPAVWMMLEGSLATTPRWTHHPPTPYFKIDSRNLGFLTTLRIGTDEEKCHKWYLEHISIRSDVTGIRYHFPCGRWFGKDVDDGSLERILVATVVHDEEDVMHSQPMSVVGLSSPALVRGRRGRNSRSESRGLRDRSPSTGRSTLQPREMRAGEVEEVLGECMNALVRHLHAHPDGSNRAQLIQLLCAPGGLIEAMEAAFLCGRNEAWTSRLFRATYPWDYVEKVAIWMHDLSRKAAWRDMDLPKQQLIKYLLRLVKRISEKEHLGKDGKFHVFLLVSLREHTLCALVTLMAWTPITQHMFHAQAFLRNSLLLSRFSKLLDSLSEFTLHIDSSLTYGIS